MKIIAKTDIGNQRSENQDNYRAGRQADDTVWAMVCDGMGGARGGKLASTLVSEYMEEKFVQGIDAFAQDGSLGQFLLQSLREANHLVYTTAQNDSAVQGMGTTVVCSVIRDGVLQCVHAGDSRAYLYHEGSLVQITKDHSMVQELVEQGKISEEEATVHPNKNLITRALGVNDFIDLDYNSAPMAENDVLVLCTDGLTNCISNEEIAEVIQTTPFEETANALVSRALQIGGQDNITVLLVQAQLPEDENDG